MNGETLRISLWDSRDEGTTTGTQTEERNMKFSAWRKEPPVEAGQYFFRRSPDDPTPRVYTVRRIGRDGPMFLEYIVNERTVNQTSLRQWCKAWPNGEWGEVARPELLADIVETLHQLSGDKPCAVLEELKFAVRRVD